MLVVEHGSFQRAAAASRRSRARLRRQVERLEAALEVSLLRRTARGAEPTTAGRELLSGATALLRDAQQLVTRARESRGETRGLLRLVTPLGLDVGPRARALTLLRDAAPELDIDLREAEDPLTLLSEPFDLMLHFGDAPDREGWFSHVVMRLPTRLRASAPYLERHGRPATLDALAEHALLLWSPGERARGLPLRGGGSHRATPWLRSANVALLQQLARDGQGLLYGPVLPPVLDDRGAPLSPVLEDIIGSTVVVRALSPRASREDLRVRALLDNIKRLLAAFAGAPEPAPPP